MSYCDLLQLVHLMDSGRDLSILGIDWFNEKGCSTFQFILSYVVVMRIVILSSFDEKEGKREVIGSLYSNRDMLALIEVEVCM